MYQQLIGLTLFISMATVNCVVNTVPCDFNKLCSCSGTTSPIREVNCLGLTINRIPKLPDNIHIYRLNIVNSPDVEYLLNNSLGLTLVSSLVVKRCGLLTIEPMAFNGTQSSLTTLDLSYNQLNNVPSLQGLTSLQWLSLKSNRLTNLNLNQWKHLFSSSLKELRNLIISDNLVTTIPDLIFNSITSLQSLDLDNNRIATIDGKPFPSSLTSLSLANNLLEKIPSEPLWSLNKLRWLNLRGNLIANLPNYWPLTVQTIELIDLSHNLLTSLSNQFVIPLSKLKSSTYNKRVSKLYPKVVQHLPDDDSDDLIQTNETAIHIRELLLDFNSIATIDELTFKWVIIDRLSLANNQLNNLPENLFENSLLSNRLRVFDVSFNPAISLMGQPLKSLTRLTNLLVKGVKLSFMGQSFFSNSSSELQMVDLSCNQLKSVPTQALSTTRKLIRLNLADNEIIKLNGDSFGKWSAKLLSLSLSKNGLQFISPDTFKNTVNLRELRLGFNNLLTTSSTYGQFLIPLRSSLTILELSYSIGSQLFSTLRSMVKLELLELDNNRLIDRDSLDNIKELTSLVHIDLEGNQLMSLPISLFNGSVHTKLRNIVVSSNKLVQIGGKTFNSLGQVVTIDLRGNQLTKLEETSFNNLPMLQTLILARNQLGSLDDRRIIVNCSNLVNLHLQENQLKFIDFSSFSDIRPTSLAAKNLSNPFGINLNVSHNQLSHIYVSEPNFDLIADFNVNGWVNGSETLISTTTSTTTVKPGKLVTPLPVTTPTLPDSAGNNATNETVPNEVNNNDDLSQEMNNNLPADQPIGIKRKVGLPIRSLDLSYNRLTELNTNISKAIGGNLVTLNLNHNGLTSFPVDSFHHLTSLMSLSLSNNLISQLPDLQLNQSFTPSTSPFTSSSSSNHSCCENLIFLDLSYNNITNIVPFGQIFSSMVNLMILDLSYNAINIIHPTIFNGTKVSKLNLKGNHLSSLTLLKPSSLPSTSSARKHNHPSHHHHHHHHNHNHHHHQQHTHNDHQDTPEYSPGQLIMDMNWPCFGISSTLVHLDLSDNHFYSIPSEIYSCQHLIHLNLQSNHLHQFHESLVFLSTLPKLRHLDLSYNPINGDFTSNNRKQLSLSTGGNKRETITFSALQYLHVQNCSLPTIPAIKSTHLIYLDVSHNVLYNISSSILSDIPNLLHLNLSFNELPVVPEELGLLRSLITLSLSGNPISNLDSSSFTPFKQLKTIDIRSLSLRYIDIRMFNSLKYLTDLATSTYPRVRSFRLADLLTKSLSLRSALIQVEEPILSHQIQWAFGSKLRQLIITGHQLKKILPDAFLGLHHRPDMVLRIVDTNISVLPTGLLRYLNDIRHITIDLRRNQLTQFNLDILQPIEATKSSFPFHVPFSSNGITLSGGLLLEDNPLICSCDITWLGSWLRKWLKETRKIHLLNHDTFLSTESKARLMTCKYPTKSIMNRNISIISIDLRPKANLPSIPLLDLYPQDIGCNCCSTNLSLAQLFLLQYSVYLFMVGLS